MNALTYTAAAKAIRALGFKVSRTDGEIRVAWPNNESAAYYTDCPEDALGTAQSMAIETAPAPDSVEVLSQTFEISGLTVIGEVDGVTYYECPVEGDESPLCTLHYDATGKPSLISTDEWDLPDSQVAPAAIPAVQTIDCTPTWSSLARVFRAIAEDGDATGRETVWQEIGRALALADNYVELQRTDTQQPDGEDDTSHVANNGYSDFPGQGE